MIKVMKVLHLISSKGFFGAENVVFTLAKEQKRQGIEVFIGTFLDAKHPHCELVEKAQKCGIPTALFTCGNRFNLSTIIAIRKFIKQNKIQVIHSHNYKSNFYSLVCAIGLKTRKVVTCHNWTTNELKMNLYKELDKALLNWFDRVVVVSDILRDEVVKSHVSEKKIRVIYNGVDCEALQTAVRNSGDEESRKTTKNRLGIKDDEKIIGTVGRLSEEKGLEYLIKSFAQVAAQISAVKLLIVGDGPLRERLLAASRALKIDEKVIFTGYRSDAAELLSLMDVFVLPSLYEGLPMVILEAGVLKKPVVASDVGAVSRVIDNESLGLLVRPADEDKLTQAVVSLLKDERQARLKGENIFVKVENNFSAEKMARDYREVYESICRAWS